MRMATGRVVNGRVELPEDAFEEGEVVTVLAEDEAESVELSDDQVAELEVAMAAGDRGEAVPVADVFRRLGWRW